MSFYKDVFMLKTIQTHKSPQNNYIRKIPKAGIAKTRNVWWSFSSHPVSKSPYLDLWDQAPGPLWPHFLHSSFLLSPGTLWSRLVLKGGWCVLAKGRKAAQLPFPLPGLLPKKTPQLLPTSLQGACAGHPVSLTPFCLFFSYDTL